MQHVPDNHRQLARGGDSGDVLAAASSDVENLLASTRIATLFLDGELRVKSFTPAATDLLGVTEADRGQPAGRAVRRLRYDALESDAASVHRTLTQKEVQLRSEDDRWYLVRLLPYRSIENVIDGVSNLEIVGPWCKLFHHTTEYFTIGTLTTPTIARIALARSARCVSSNDARSAM